MSFQSVYCQVSHERVPCARDLEGHRIHVYCSDLNATTGLCRRQTMAHDNGWLGEFLERADEDTLEVRGSRCRLLDAAVAGRAGG